MKDKPTDRFIQEFSKSLAEHSFVKATIGDYTGGVAQLQKVRVRPVTIREKDLLQFVYSFRKRDIVKNHTRDEALPEVRRLFESGFRSGHLFTLEHDYQLEFSRRKRGKIKASAPTFSQIPEQEHDRERKMPIDPSRRYLFELGITTSKGEVKSRSRSKWKQINQFVRIVSQRVERVFPSEDRGLEIADMGCGKGYLTFALYDHLRNKSDAPTRITGIERDPELVDKCNTISRDCGFTGLEFMRGDIRDTTFEKLDIMIALHACDTATDEALFKGIMAGAGLILAAPCCHREIRAQISVPDPQKDMLKYGLLIEREAETVTDALRALLLEDLGYTVKMIEFVAPGHTPKNNLIIAELPPKPTKTRELENQITSLMSFYGISEHRLRSLLKQVSGSDSL